MKNYLIALLVFAGKTVQAQNNIENIIIITTDGLRWQEIFKGMDPVIANNKKYWGNSEDERREKLMPFLWKEMVPNGQLYGNRSFKNKVDNTNPYWFSYPGYSEIMTGHADTAINSNDFPPNPNVTVLEFLNGQPGIKGKVAAFGAWAAFDRILNEKRSGIPVFCAFDTLGGKWPTANEKLLNEMNNDAFKPFGEEECLDVFTHYGAMEYLRTRRPKVLYIAYGETDEWAHSRQYKNYLDAAHQVDAWIEKIWQFVQQDPQYRNKTALLFTTDHGRGDVKKNEWTSHNNKIADSHEIWMAVMGPGIAHKGELKTDMQLYQKQFAQTIAQLLGHTFTATHPVAEAVDLR